MNISPIAPWIIVERDPDEQVTESGIVMTGESPSNFRFGTVKEAPQYKFSKNGTKINLPFKKGDRIMFGKLGGREIDGTFFMRDIEVVAVVEG